MTIQLKVGTSLKKLQPQMVLAAFIVESIYARNGAKCTITSGNDSVHSKASLHYRGNALDFRTKDYVSSKTMLLGEIKRALGAEFDVILESLNEDQEHLHVEWDPK